MVALMDNVTDPQMLYQLVSASAHAKRCFSHQPVGYLKASLSNMSPKFRQLAIAYIIEAEYEPDSDGTPVEDRSYTDAEHVTAKQEWTESECSCRQSTIVDNLDEYLGDPQPSIPVDLLDPLGTLKTLSATYEAIETLVDADIWTVVAKAPSNDSSPRTRQRIKRALWYLELFCTIFHQDCLATRYLYMAKSTFVTLIRNSMAIDQRRFFHYLSSEERGM